LLFLINAAAGSSDADALRQVIEAALLDTGRRGELRFSRGEALVSMARETAQDAARQQGAVVAVGAGCCAVEQWDFAAPEQALRRAAMTELYPAR